MYVEMRKEGHFPLNGKGSLPIDSLSVNYSLDFKIGWVNNVRL